MTDVFSTDNTDNQNHLETLVGEGKKYKSTDDLAKAYVNADAAIKARETELANLRQELSTRLSVEEQLAKANQREPNRAPDPPRQDPPKSDPAISPEDLDARILEVTSRAGKLEQARRNLEDVTSRMVETFGDTEKANQVVRAKATELGVSVEFLMDAARQSPKAFYAQLGLDNPTSSPRPAPSRGEVAIHTSSGVSRPGSYEYYEDIRKSNPKSYFTPKIQNQLMKDALEGRYNPPDR